MNPNPHYLIDMNLPDFKVPETLSIKQPPQSVLDDYRVQLNKWKSIENNPEPKPEAPQPIKITNAQVTHDILKTALNMAVPSGTPDVLRKLQKINKLIEDGLANKGQLVLSQNDHKFLQSKYAKADKWNTIPDVCNTVIEIQDAITRAVFVTTK